MLLYYAIIAIMFLTNVLSVPTCMSGPIDQFLGLLRGCREQRRDTIIIAVLNILYDTLMQIKITCPYNYTEITMLYTQNNLYVHYMQNHGVLSHYVLQQYL